MSGMKGREPIVSGLIAALRLLAVLLTIALAPGRP